MSRAIWKFPLAAPDVSMRMPEGAVPVHVDYDERTGAICIWAEVDTDPSIPRVERKFTVLPTGGDIPEIHYTEKIGLQVLGETEPRYIDGEEKVGWPIYIGTAHTPNAEGGPRIVWHIFELPG